MRISWGHGKAARGVPMGTSHLTDSPLAVKSTPQVGLFTEPPKATRWGSLVPAQGTPDVQSLFLGVRRCLHPRTTARRLAVWHHSPLTNSFLLLKNTGLPYTGGGCTAWPDTRSHKGFLGLPLPPVAQRNIRNKGEKVFLVCTIEVCQSPP